MPQSYRANLQVQRAQRRARNGAHARSIYCVGISRISDVVAQAFVAARADRVDREHEIAVFSETLEIKRPVAAVKVGRECGMLEEASSDGEVKRSVVRSPIHHEAGQPICEPSSNKS